MIKVTGTAYVAKKDIKALRYGMGGEKTMNLRLKNKNDDKEFYIASIIGREDASMFDLIEVGDTVKVEGSWIIKKNKQNDGTFRYYNVIYLDSIEPIT